MTTATKERKSRKAKVEKPMPVLIARAVFKATGSVIYAVRAEEQMYHVTVIDGKAKGCRHADDGETCTGFSYRKNCNHVKVALASESKRQEELAAAASVAPLVLGEQFAEDLPAHVADEVADLPIVLVDANDEWALVLQNGQELTVRVSELDEQIGDFEEVYSVAEFEELKADATRFERQAEALIEQIKRDEAESHLTEQQRRSLAKYREETANRQRLQQMADRKREDAPLQPSGHIAEETEFGFVPMRRTA